MVVEDNVDIHKFSKTVAFLKRKNVGNHPEKFEVLSARVLIFFISGHDIERPSPFEIREVLRPILSGFY